MVVIATLIDKSTTTVKINSGIQMIATLIDKTRITIGIAP